MHCLRQPNISCYLPYRRYAKLISDYNRNRPTRGLDRNQGFSMIDRVKDLRQTHADISGFAENNRLSLSTKCVVTEEVVSEEDADNWGVCLKLYKDGVVVSQSFCPPPRVHGVKVLIFWRLGGQGLF